MSLTLGCSATLSVKDKGSLSALCEKQLVLCDITHQAVFHMGGREKGVC